MPINDLAIHLKLSNRSTQALISCASSLKLVECKNNKYQLSELGKKYLNEKNPEYYGNVFDLLIQENEIMNYSNIKKAILTNKSQVNQGKELFKNEDTICSTQAFIESLHHKAYAPALFWPNIIDLSNHHIIIDIGCGSGIHSISACSTNTNLMGIACDRALVTPFTQKYIHKFR